MRQYIKRNGTMTFGEVYTLLQPLMKALESIHAKGLIHRDISPSNIMLMNDGSVKLLDFGATRDIHDESAKSIVLKPGYSPEEQYRSMANLGPYTDVYALCATMYFLLTGSVPDNAMERVLGDHLRTPYMLGARISENEEQVLMKGMAVLAKDRIQTIQELQEALRTGVLPMSDAVYEEDEEDEKTVAVISSAAVSPSDAEAPIADRSEKRSVWRNVVPKPQEPEIKAEQVPQNRPAPQEQVPEKKAHRAEEKRELERALKEEQEPERNIIAAPKIKGNEIKEEGRPKKRRVSKRSYGAEENQKKPSKLKKVIWLPIIAMIAVIGIAIYLLSGRGVTGADGYESGSTAVAFRDQVVTDKMIKSIGNRKEINSVFFSRCEIGDAQIETLTELDGQVIKIDFSSCTGYTTLDPLSEMTSLKNLQLSGINYDLTDNTGDYTINGSTVFTKEFSNLEYLSLTNFEFGGDMTFLSHFPKLKSLYMNGQGVSDLDSLACEDTITTLHIYDTDLSQVNLEHLAGFVNLTRLELENCSCGDVSWMKGMSVLSEVNLSNDNLSSMPMLSATRLYSVDVSDNQLTDLNWLPAQEGDSSLRIYINHNQVSDISALAEAPGLFAFEAVDNQISDISSLAGKSSLRILDLDNNQITDASALSDAADLETFYISENQIKNLDFCKNITTLTKVSAHHNAITDISGLVNTTQLEEVVLSDNQIMDASVLGKSAAHLQIAILDNNQIADISMLKGAAELTTLSIDHNKLTTLDGLESSAKLYAVSACGNELTDISALSGMTALYLVDLGENQLTDISALSSVNVSKMALLVENNQISDISMLNVNCDYNYLSLYNNSIKDYSVLMGNQTIGAYDYLYVSWDEEADLTGVGASKYEWNLNLVDVPLDRQQELVNTFEEAKEEYQDSTWPEEPTFLTTEEADQQIEALRQEIRKVCGLVTDADDEESTDENTDE